MAFQQGCTSDCSFCFSLQKTWACKEISGLQSDKDTPRGMARPLVVVSDQFCLSHCAFNLSLVTDWGYAVYLSLSAQVVDHQPVARMTQLMRHCYIPLGTMMTPAPPPPHTHTPSSATDLPLPLSKAISQAVLCDKQIKFAAWQPPQMKWQNGGIGHISFLLEIQRDTSSWCDNCKPASAACHCLEPVEMDSWFGRLLV